MKAHVEGLLYRFNLQSKTHQRGMGDVKQRDREKRRLFKVWHFCFNVLNEYVAVHYVPRKNSLRAINLFRVKWRRRQAWSPANSISSGAKPGICTPLLAVSQKVCRGGRQDVRTQANALAFETQIYLFGEFTWWLNIQSESCMNWLRLN